MLLACWRWACSSAGLDPKKISEEIEIVNAINGKVIIYSELMDTPERGTEWVLRSAPLRVPFEELDA